LSQGTSGSFKKSAKNLKRPQNLWAKIVKERERNTEREKDTEMNRVPIRERGGGRERGRGIYMKIGESKTLNERDRM